MATVSCGEKKKYLADKINSGSKDDTVKLLSTLNENKLKEILQRFILNCNSDELNRLYIKSKPFSHFFHNHILQNTLSFLPTPILCNMRSVCTDFKTMIDSKLKPFANGIIHITETPDNENDTTKPPNYYFKFQTDNKTGNHIYISPQMIQTYFLNKHSYIFKQCKVIQYDINVRHSMQCLQLLWHTFPNLSCLYLNSYEPSTSTNNGDVIKIFRKFPDDGFKSIHIGLTNDYNSDGRGTHAVLFRNLLNVQKLRNNLFALHLMNNKLANSYLSDNDGILTINENKWPVFKKLKCLILSNMTFEGNTLNLLLDNCKQLKVLKLKNVIWNGYLTLPYGVKYVFLSDNSLNCNVQFSISSWYKLSFLIIETECINNEKFKRFIEKHAKQFGKKVLNVGLSHCEYVKIWNDNIGFEKNKIKLMVHFDDIKNLERNNICCDNIQFADRKVVMKKSLCKECIDIIQYGYIQK